MAKMKYYFPAEGKGRYWGKLYAALVTNAEEDALLLGKIDFAKEAHASSVQAYMDDCIRLSGEKTAVILRGYVSALGQFHRQLETMGLQIKQSNTHMPPQEELLLSSLTKEDCLFYLRDQGKLMDKNPRSEQILGKHFLALKTQNPALIDAFVQSCRDCRLAGMFAGSEWTVQKGKNYFCVTRVYRGGFDRITELMREKGYHDLGGKIQNATSLERNLAFYALTAR